ncbi:MAG: hydantoinase B/oxoprolinase family protein [Planctomycetes bacterium]|nr:hydantoinase B/oxoprolinase family protein [Planctomycetota bacterium]
MDAISLEIMRNALYSIADEMTVALVKTAHSTNIKDRRDCSSALLTPQGEVVAQTELGTPLHMGTMPGIVRVALGAFPPETLAPGDVIITNLPYPMGPGHLPDVTAVSPIHADGELVAVAASTAHHVDVGGFAPGSMPFGVSEIYQEGLQIPPVRILKGGRLDEDLVKLITQNVRTQGEFMGDLMAQVAANHVGGRRMGDLVRKHGVAGMRSAMAELLDYAERSMRAGIRSLPKGRFTFEDYCEGDGLVDHPIRVRVSVEIREEDVEVDFEGTSPQTRGPMNAAITAAYSCVYYVMKAVIDPDLPTSSGAYRPIRVRAPEGTVVNAKFPAAICNSNILTDQRVVDALLGALYQAIPDRVCAACSGEMNLVNLGGIDPRTGRYFNSVETYAGGQGARHDQDGMDGVHTHLTNTRNAPVEVTEATYPIRVEGYGLVPDSEGAGRFRGGCGMYRELTLLSDETLFSLSADRRELRPWGLAGGLEARGSDCWVESAGGERRQLPSKITTTLRRGETVTLVTPGGGGWGDPKERDREAVRQDVRDGLVSPERAKAVYGLDPRIPV